MDPSHRQSTLPTRRENKSFGGEDLNPTLKTDIMRFSQVTSSLLPLLLAALLHTDIVKAGPVPKDELHDLQNPFLRGRDCAIPCGSDSQYCCSSGQACYTNADNIAGCTAVAGAAGLLGGFAVYTTTYVETDLVTRTSTYTSSWYAAASTPVVGSNPAICTVEGESSCGIYCCASNQRCAGPNTCTAYTSTYFPTSTPVGSPPVRGTSGGVSTRTATVSATTTEPFTPPESASGTSNPVTEHHSSHGLSAGAIAGIVIGVIAGIILLIIFCFCCVIRAGIDGLLALFGLGKKKRRSTEKVEVIEERYSRHGSGAGKNTHNTWFGGASRPSRVSESRKKESSGFGGLGYVGAGLLGLAAILGLKRRHDRKEREKHSARSDISSSYYSYTDTSASK